MRTAFTTTTPVPQITATSRPLKQSAKVNLMRAALWGESINNQIEVNFPRQRWTSNSAKYF